ncbi:MAG: PAS domain-containing protein [Flavobacterium sp.]|nr:MAG: PAS domain-containing protein [Flavobacterium sp.]
MLDIPAFASPQDAAYYKTTSAPLFCWDIANPALEKRVQIHNDIEQLESLVLTHNWHLGIDYKAMLIHNHTLIVTNLSEEIIWASSSFHAMTGHNVDAAIGMTPSFLQGEKTSIQTKLFIREKLANFENLETRILNYRKNRETYWCGIKIFPIQTLLGNVTHYIAVEKEVN